MERKKKESKQTKEKKPMWRKITPGTLYPIPRNTSRAARQGEPFEATEEELGKYADQFEEIDRAELMNTDEGKQQAIQDHESKYKLASAGGDKYNIMGEDDEEEPINEKPMNIDEANAMKEALDREDIANEAVEANAEEEKGGTKKKGKSTPSERSSSEKSTLPGGKTTGGKESQTEGAEKGNRSNTDFNEKTVE